MMAGSALRSWLREQGVHYDRLPSDSAFRQLAGGPKAPALRNGPPRNPHEAEPLRVLMSICQKIGSTGSGIVVREIVDGLHGYGVQCLVICGAEPGDDPGGQFLGRKTSIRPVMFNIDAAGALPFAIAGMSDRMPYESVRFRDLTFAQVATYLDVWRTHIREAIASFRPHLLHVHHLWLIAALSAATATDIPSIVSLHGTDLHQASLCPHLRELVTPWTDRFLRCLALTDETVREARRLYPASADSFLVAGNGFNHVLFRPLREPPKEVVARYGLTDIVDRPIILYVGKYVEWKGIEWLLRAFGKLVCAGRTDAVLVIAGSGPDEEYWRYCSMSRSLGLESRVSFTGQVAYEDVGTLMNLARVFVLPSYHEPFGLALLEALACGLRSVSTDQGGPASFVPGDLRAKRDVILAPGLPHRQPSSTSAAVFVGHLYEGIAEQLAKPLSFEQRCQIADSVRHMTWSSYVQRLVVLYGQATLGGTVSA
jgi:glycosyltransferase involved in cell wall biosynthesis